MRSVFSKAERVQADFILKKAKTTQEEDYSAWKLISKYPKELKKAGIDFFSIPEPELKPRDIEGYRGTVTKNGERFIFKFDYDYFLIEIIKKIAGSRYNGKDKTWTVPINQRSKHFAYGLIKKDNFYCSPNITTIIEELDQKYKEIAGESTGDGEVLKELVQAIEEYLDHEADDQKIYIYYKEKLFKALEKAKEDK